MGMGRKGYVMYCNLKVINAWKPWSWEIWHIYIKWLKCTKQLVKILWSYLPQEKHKKSNEIPMSSYMGSFLFFNIMQIEIWFFLNSSPTILHVTLASWLWSRNISENSTVIFKNFIIFYFPFVGEKTVEI